MDKIDAIITWFVSLIPAAIRGEFKNDKLKHFVAGFLVSAPFAIAGYFELALVVAFAAGAIKEALDYSQNVLAKLAGRPAPHEVSVLNFLATLSGGAAAAAIGIGVLHLLTAVQV